MSRFKDLCSSSDSDSQQETQQSYQRGRVRQNKRFTEIKADEKQQGIKKQTPVIIKKQQQKVKNNLPTITQTNLWIETNQYKQNSSLNISEKFIRENIKPAQQQMKHYLQKMRNTLQQRKKFINALTSAGRDLEKVGKKIQQIKATKYNNDDLYNQQITKKRQTQQQSSQITKKPHPSNVTTMLNLQQKIQRHLSNLMTQHQKTIQTLMLCRKQINNYFNKVKFTFLDINSISLFQQQTQTYQQYGIQQMYKIIKQADDIIDQQTSFMK